MSFPAKFGGTCSKCGIRIAPQSLVNYDGSAIRHAPRCPPKGTVVEAAISPKTETVTDDAKVWGRATYKGKSGYLILWMGTTSRGEAVKLAFRDGSKIFWADRKEITVEKTYNTEYQKTAYDTPVMTFGRLNTLAKRMKETPEADRGKCESCGRWHGNHASDCDMAAGGMSYRNSQGHFVLGADD